MLSRDGSMFSTFLHRLATNPVPDAGTLLVIRTLENETFGAYSSGPYERSARAPPTSHQHSFFGGPRNFLFRCSSLFPPTVYPASGLNPYYMTLDKEKGFVGFGCGGGGKESEQESSFGLAFSDDFFRGSTGYSDTYSNEPLCSTEIFAIMNVEVYGFEVEGFNELVDQKLIQIMALS